MTVEKIRAALISAGQKEVIDYIALHSSTSKLEHRLFTLYNWISRGEVIELRHDKTIPLRREYRPLRITELDKPLLFN